MHRQCVQNASNFQNAVCSNTSCTDKCDTMSLIIQNHKHYIGLTLCATASHDVHCNYVVTAQAIGNHELW